MLPDVEGEHQRKEVILNVPSILGHCGAQLQMFCVQESMREGKKYPYGISGLLPESWPCLCCGESFLFFVEDVVKVSCLLQLWFAYRGGEVERRVGKIPCHKVVARLQERQTACIMTAGSVNDTSKWNWV